MRKQARDEPANLCEGVMIVVKSNKRQTSPEVASKASKVMRDPHASKAARVVAASALAQARLRLKSRAKSKH